MRGDKRVFNVDIEICSRCGGAINVIACIEEQALVNKILVHLNDQQPLVLIGEKDIFRNIREKLLFKFSGRRPLPNHSLTLARSSHMAADLTTVTGVPREPTLDWIHQQWVATLDAIRDPIFVIDTTGRVIRANRSFARLVECDFSEFLGRSLACLLPWLSTVGDDETAVSPDGHVFRVRATAHDRRLDGQVIILEDVSVQVALESAERRHQEVAERTLEETLKTLSAVQDKKDPYTVEHNKNVADVATRIAERLQISNAETRGIYLGALPHDIGKLSVPSSILNRPDKLLAEEMDLIRLHPTTGFSFVENVVFPWPVHEIILQHHERIDGSGYPHGLRGNQISLAARIVAVADVADAMSSDRPYRLAPGIDAAVQELTRGKGCSYDTDVVEAMVDIVDTNAHALPQTWRS